jgi:hypothetical protein
LCRTHSTWENASGRDEAIAEHPPILSRVSGYKYPPCPILEGEI